MRVILFDLDNTLLENDMEDFIPAYLDALGRHMSDLYHPDEFIRTLMRATNAMVANPDSSSTNMEAFNVAFFPALGCTPAGEPQERCGAEGDQPPVRWEQLHVLQ